MLGKGVCLAEQETPYIYRLGPRYSLDADWPDFAAADRDRKIRRLAIACQAPYLPFLTAVLLHNFRLSRLLRSVGLYQHIASGI